MSASRREPRSDETLKRSQAAADARRKEQLEKWRAEADGTLANEGHLEVVSESTQGLTGPDIQDIYKTNMMQKGYTFKRPVGGKKKIFDQLIDEAGEGGVKTAKTSGGALYLDVCTWTFPNQKTVDEFIEVISRIIEQNREPECMFKVLRDPRSTGSRHNEYMPGRKIFITTVSIGTCDQFTDMHRLFDVSGEINASKSKGLKGQSGVDKIEGTFYCRSATAEVRECLSAWNEIEHYDYNLVETRQGLGAPGGWRTVAKHIMSLSEDDDLMLVLKSGVAVGPRGLEAEMTRHANIMTEYNKFAPQLQPGAMFKNIFTPVNVVAVQGFWIDSVIMVRASTYLAALTAAGPSNTNELMDQMNNKTVTYCTSSKGSKAVAAMLAKGPQAKKLTSVILEY